VVTGVVLALVVFGAIECPPQLSYRAACEVKCEKKTFIFKNILFWGAFILGNLNGPLGRKWMLIAFFSGSFASLGFLSFYIAGRLHTFSGGGRGQGWRIIAFVVPLSAALLIALSRTCDYHHHWQDVLCGSLLGISIAYMCYRHYYPSLNSLQAHRPYCEILPAVTSYEKVSSELI